MILLLFQSIPMPRGGYREKAGRKSGWIHRETQVIRVPAALAEKLIEIAKKLDDGTFTDSDTESLPLPVDSVSESKNELVTESIKHILSDWRQRADAASPKNADWRKVRQMLSELEPIVYEGMILESVTKSKEHPGQMKLPLGQDSIIETVTESEKDLNENVTESFNLQNESVTESEVLSKSPFVLRPLKGRVLPVRLGCHPQVATNKKNIWKDCPEKFVQWSKSKDPDGIAWEYREDTQLYHPILESATPLDQVNPLPEGSERSGEG